MPGGHAWKLGRVSVRLGIFWGTFLGTCVGTLFVILYVLVVVLVVSARVRDGCALLFNLFLTMHEVRTVCEYATSFLAHGCIAARQRAQNEFQWASAPPKLFPKA